jgi:hypothetical protein
MDCSGATCGQCMGGVCQARPQCCNKYGCTCTTCCDKFGCRCC